MIHPLQLAAKALCAEKTAKAWLDAEKRKRMKPLTAERVRRAAIELGWTEEPTTKPPPEGRAA